jgi:hypothetical protein
MKIKQSGDGLWAWKNVTYWEGGYLTRSAAERAALNAAAGKRWDVAVIRVGA